MRRVVGFGVCVVVLLVASSCSRAPSFRGEVVEPVAAAPAIDGVNWDGEPFHLRELEGQVAVVFFGYTFCPDVCPMTLGRMKAVRQGLGERADEVAVVFVSIDPARDSAEKLAAYVPAFDKGFYGVRLEDEQVIDTAEAWGVTVERGAVQEGTAGFYLVDHTPTAFVVDRAGNLRLKFPTTAELDAIRGDLVTLLETS